MLNKIGYGSFDMVLEWGFIVLMLECFEEMVESEEVLMFDMCYQDDFVKVYIFNFIFIGIDGSFVLWVGVLIKDLQQFIVLIMLEGCVEEVVICLVCVGYDNILGYLEGGVEVWQVVGKEVDIIVFMIVDEVVKKLEGDVDFEIFDVCKLIEYLL